MNPTPKSLATPVALLALAAGAPAAQARTSTARSALPGTPETVARGALPLGLLADDAPAEALVGLRHRDEAGLKAFIAKVSDPRSPTYAHYLDPNQFEARYAPTDATVDEVEGFLRGAGLSVVDVPHNRAYVQIKGTAGAVRRAFGVQLERYRYRHVVVQAPLSVPTVPASLASVITGVTGLDTSAVATPAASPPPAFVNAAPCSTSFGEKLATDLPDYDGAKVPYVPCGYTPQQLQGAYGTAPAIAAGLDGTGQSVAIIDAYSSPLITSDATTWSKNHGLPDPQITINDNLIQSQTPEIPSVPTDIPIVGGIGLVDPQGWAGEETLDVEAVHAMAPKAQIVYQGAASPLNMFLHVAQNKVVMNKEAQIVSNSYGGATDTTDATSDGYWMQAAAQGMGVYFSSGDAGDETLGSGDTADRQVDGGGNSPYVTAVGGTTLGVDKDNGYGFETYWGTYSATGTTGATGAWGTPAYNSGGGGGTSQMYAEPDYQKAVVPDRFSRFWENDKNKASGALVPGRVTPDVAMVGDPNSGFLMGQVQDFDQYANPGGTPLPTDETKYSEYRIGGTSLSSPLFAGVMALADQAAGKPHGFANPALYAASGAGAFRDVTAPATPKAVVRVNYTNNTDATDGTQTFLRTAGNTQTLSSVPGYDDSTGLGSPNGLAFLRALAPGSTKIPADPSPASTTTTTTAGGTQGAGSTTTVAGSTPPPSGTTPAGATPGQTATACTPPARLRFALHHARGQRVVRALLLVDGKQTITRAGRSLTRITIRRPKGTRFTVTIRTVSETGAVKTSTRTYTHSGCTRGRVTTKDSHTR